MRPKYKVTGCARFFVFLIIFVPVVFFGAAYFRGENGVQIIKDFYHSIVGGNSVGDGAERQKGGKAEESDKAKDKAEAKETYNVEDLKEELKKAKDEIKSLKEELEAKDKEIEKLKAGK